MAEWKRVRVSERYYINYGNGYCANVYNHDGDVNAVFSLDGMFVPLWVDSADTVEAAMAKCDLYYDIFVKDGD